MHSTFSDGELTPEELVDYALDRGVLAIALTDHDRTEGNSIAQNYAKEKDLEFVPGIEITTTPPEGVKELHIVGLFIDSENEEIKKIPARHREYAIKNTKIMIEKINDLGYEITFEELLKETDGKHLGRPFIAKILMRKYPDKFPNRKIVFNELLGKQGKAFVRPQGTELSKTIKIIHNAGGIAIVAHPWYLGENMIEILEKFVLLGGDGIEVDHTPKETIQEDTRYQLEEFVKKHNLIVSGGTDFHKKEEGEKEMGDRGISKEEFNKLKKYNQRK